MSNLIPFWESFEFLFPWMVAVVILPWVIRLIWTPAETRQTPLLAPQIMGRLQGNPTESNLSHNKLPAGIPLIYSLCWLLLVLASMRPVWFLTPTPFEVSGKDMILAVDLSGSMQKEDMRVAGRQVDRLVAVKSVVNEFIKQREGDRLGLLVFGSQAFVQSPLTYDLQTVGTLLNETEIGMAGKNTAIGEAIGLTLKHLDQVKHRAGIKPSVQNTVLILLTDGSNTAGVVEPMDAAEQAKKAGLKIYTIGIGQADGFGALNGMGGIASFFPSSRVSMDVASLKAIAKLTGGHFFHAKDTRQLNDIYEVINQLESTKHQVNQYRLRSELFYYPLAVFLSLTLLIAIMRLWFPFNSTPSNKAKR